MSADSHEVCPRCHPEVLDVHDLLANTAEELGLPREVREEYETYLEATPSGLELVHVYRARCWTCDWAADSTTRTGVSV